MGLQKRGGRGEEGEELDLGFETFYRSSINKLSKRSWYYVYKYEGGSLWDVCFTYKKLDCSKVDGCMFCYDLFCFVRLKRLHSHSCLFVTFLFLNKIRLICSGIKLHSHSCLFITFRFLYKTRLIFSGIKLTNRGPPSHWKANIKVYI